MTVLIAGGGIAGLTLALTCHQIGVSAVVLESAREIKPLGVGINVQPVAVRELCELGFEENLAAIGVETKEYALIAKNGLEVWSEPRGKLAGYKWPQYSLHRGKIHMMLYEAVLDRLGKDAVITDAKIIGYENIADEVRVDISHRDGSSSKMLCDLLIGADGLHSAVRRQMHPDEGEPIWSGAILWRGTSVGKATRTGASMSVIGNQEQKFVSYPISAPDAVTGLSTINWIAELSYDPAQGYNKEDWTRQANLDDFLPKFEDWRYDWLNVPELIKKAKAVYEYPMVDRDPLTTWRDGRVALMGDAAHIMYPVGSNGASQAIIDARAIGQCFLEYGVGVDALIAYDREIRPGVGDVILRNRQKGPEQIMIVVEERCNGHFENIDAVISKGEMAKIAKAYKLTAGLDIDVLNNKSSVIPAGAKLS